MAFLTVGSLSKNARPRLNVPSMRAQHVEEMDGGRFDKLCRDCGLMDGKAITSTAVDLAFARAKVKVLHRVLECRCRVFIYLRLPWKILAMFVTFHCAG